MKIVEGEVVKVASRLIEETKEIRMEGPLLSYTISQGAYIL